jgi:hypothetical protein
MEIEFNLNLKFGQSHYLAWKLGLKLPFNIRIGFKGTI